MRYTAISAENGWYVARTYDGDLLTWVHVARTLGNLMDLLAEEEEEESDA